ncbi:hypothetical protein [Fervidicola ferrireducens]|nr:hypothetical protein [Fervidicola ferrireducens]
MATEMALEFSAGGIKEETATATASVVEEPIRTKLKIWVNIENLAARFCAALFLRAPGMAWAKNTKYTYNFVDKNAKYRL